MRQDQFEKLQALGEKLTDVFLVEADSGTWSADRGDRYWEKKNAAATLAIVQRISHLVDVVRAKTAAGQASPDAVTEGDNELEREIAGAEKEATRLMNRLQKRGKP